MLIKTLDLRNFQKHKSLSLKFSKYLTVIKGTSGIGKSAILRSLFQLVDESIPWNVCHTWDTDDTHIRLRGIIDGKEHTIERVHSSKDNKVIIDGTSYDYVGKSAPEILKTKLNIREQNIQKQKNHWFLIDMKPGHLSKELNSVSGLNIIDASLQEISSRVRSSQTEIRLLKAQAAVLDKEIQALSYVEEADLDLKVLETSEHIFFDAEDTLKLLQGKYDEFNKYAAQLKLLPKGIEKALDDAEQAYALYKKREREYQQILSLNKLNSEIVSKIDTKLPQVEIALSQVEESKDAFQKAKSRYEEIKNMANLCKEAEDDMASIEKNIKMLEEMKAKAESMLGICPTCKRPL